MNRKAIALAMQFVIAAAMILTGRAASAQEIHLKARNINTTSTSLSAAHTQERTAHRASAAGPAHQIVQFDHTPGVADIEALMAAGYTVIGAVPDNALMVVASASAAVLPAGVKWTGELEAGDKISAALANETGTVSAVVEFHTDVDPGTFAAIGAAAGIALERPAGLLANHTIASATVAQLRVLAASDEVDYIFPADPALSTPGSGLMPCAGMLTTGGTIGNYANVVQGWDMDGNVAQLGYFFGALTPKVPASTVQAAILQAMSAWSAVTNVAFSPAASATAVRTVMIEFASGAHGDAYPFDSAGEILAHTFYPVPLNSESIAGDMHFNESVNWHSGSDIDIYSVALHELGHALGLGHTDTPADVMYPYYRRGMALSTHDIGAVQALYGAPGEAPAQAGAITAAPAPAAPIAPAPAPAPAAPVATPVSLVLNAIASPGTAADVAISGTVTGGVAPLTVSWQTNQGYSGKATLAANGTWTASGVTLAPGANTITATVFDSASKTATESATVTRQQASTTSAVPMSIHITSPSTAVVTQSGASISLSGTASGGTGVTSVTWQTTGGATGTATGVGPWVAANIPLLVGNNTIMVKAFDAGTDSAWASIVVTRQ